MDGTTTPRKNGGNSMRRMGGTDCPTEDTTHVANYNNDEPYVNDECYSIRMGGGNGDSPGGTPEKNQEEEQQENLCTVMMKILQNFSFGWQEGF